MANKIKKQFLNHDFEKSQTVLDTDIAVVSFSDNAVHSSINNGSPSLSLFNTLDKKNASNVATTRFNPFNKGSDESERSFSTDTSEKDSSCSGSVDTSFAELGITENYFAHPDGNLGLSSIEELEMAIDNCKSLIVKLSENSNKRKKLVKNLVDLRYRLQKLKDDPVVIEPRTKLIRGHKLKKRTSRSMKNYCDCCTNLIWGMIQVWYKCSECGFCCHSKCVANLRRPCAAAIVTLQLNICPEIGLSQQQYSCAECRNTISIMSGTDEARICNYNGLYYCSNCHWNDLMVIPGRIVHNWDLSQYPVCRQSFQILTNLYDKPTLNLNLINPMLFNYVEELSEIRKMREDIIKMKEYFLTCTVALNMKLLLMLKKRQYFVDNSMMYSVMDLVETSNGSLTNELTVIHTTFAKHIKLDCMFCQAKGFICEICNSGETLYPFDSAVVSTCSKCSAVFHRDCFSCIDILCPRCKRKNHKREISSFSEDLSSSDFSEEEILPVSSHYSKPVKGIDMYTTVKVENEFNKELKLGRGRSNAISQNMPQDAKSSFHQWVNSKKVNPKVNNGQQRDKTVIKKQNYYPSEHTPPDNLWSPVKIRNDVRTNFGKKKLEEGAFFPLLQNSADFNGSLSPYKNLPKSKSFQSTSQEPTVTSMVSNNFLQPKKSENDIPEFRSRSSVDLKQTLQDPTIYHLEKCDDALNPFLDKINNDNLNPFLENEESTNPFITETKQSTQDKTNPFLDDCVDSTNPFR